VWSEATLTTYSVGTVTGNNNPNSLGIWPSLREGIEARIEDASTPLQAQVLRELRDIAIEHNWDFDALDAEFPN
jgi:hypothetical protein